MSKLSFAVLRTKPQTKPQLTRIYDDNFFGDYASKKFTIVVV